MAESNEEEITLGQKMFDNIFFLLAIGLAFPGILYFGWGLLEIFLFNTTTLSEYLQQTGLGGKIMGGQ